MLQRVIAGVVVVLLLGAGVAFGYRQLVPAADPTQAGPQYATAEVTRGDLAVGVTARGTLQAGDTGWLNVPWPMFFVGRMPSNFTVTEVLVTEGDYVSEGQPLILLSAEELEGSIRELEEQLQQKQQNLADRLGISISELHTVNPARGITLRAPIDGRVTGLAIGEGKEAKQGEAVARVVQDSRWYMTVNLTTTEKNRLQVGDRLLASIEGFQGTVLGTITEINPNPVPMRASTLSACGIGGGSGDGVAGGGGGGGTDDPVHLIYRARVEGDNPGLLMPGMTARLSIAQGDDADAAGATLSHCAHIEGYANEEPVISTANGIVTRVFVSDMQMVKQGDPLVSLSGDETQRSIESDLNQIRDLQMQLDGLQSYKQQLSVAAPMDGVVSELRVRTGQRIEMGEHLGTVYNPERMEMWLQVDDVDILMVQQGAEVQITLDALPDQEFSGRVAFVSPSGRDERGFTFFQVSVTVEGSPELRPGMQAQAFIDAGAAEDVLIVPLEAVFQEDRQYKVEVLHDDGTTEVVPVTVGLMSDFYAEIKEGLTEGMKVIVGSSTDLLPGRSAPGTILPGVGSSPGGGGDGGSSGDGDGGVGSDAPLPGLAPDAPADMPLPLPEPMPEDAGGAS